MAGSSAEGREISLSEAVEKIPVHPEGSGKGYSRKEFPHWSDEDGDGCNARYEVLIEEAVEKPEVSSACELSGGTWHSYFDDVTTSDPSEISIDHMVPLHEAWKSGAETWSTEKRKRYANDLEGPASLVGVTISSNSSKSDRDPASWLPDHERCRYVSQWMETKLRWGLSADTQESKVLKRLADTCSGSVSYAPAS